MTCSEPRELERTRSTAPALALLAPGLVFATFAGAQDLTVTAPPQQQPIALINAIVHPVNGRDIEGGYVLFRNGIIEAVGSDAREFDADTLQIDCGGKHVYPGLIGAHTQLGLTEIGAVRSTQDFDEVGRISPEVRAAVAVNPDSTLLPVTRSNGVLISGIFPSGGIVPGQASVIQLEGWTWEDMTIEDRAGLVVNWPLMRTVDAEWMDRSDEDQRKVIRENIQWIEATFDAAAAYATAKAADPAIAVDLRYEAMRPYLPGAHPSNLKPVFVDAQDYVQIVAAVSFMAERGLRGAIVGGRDAHRCTDLLKRHDVAVIVTGPFTSPKRSDSPYDEAFALGAVLEAAGVRWCMASGDDTPHERNLPYAAAMAVAHGLDHDAAIRAITLSSAQILGVDDRVGSIEPGKHATLIVTTQSPLEVSSQVTHAFVQGRRIDLSNKQTKLDQKYREKYRQLDETQKR